MMTSREDSIPNPEQNKKEELLGRKNLAWEKYYQKGDFAGAKPIYDDLHRTGEEWQVDPETMAEIIADKAWNEYFIDKNGTTKTNTPYLTAREGLEKLKNLEDSPVVCALRSRLFEISGLCEAYLVDEADESSELLFKNSVEEAEKSKIVERIGEAKNGFALWLISPKQKRFEKAIPLFEDVARVQEEVGNKRTAGHACNNLTVCFNEIKQYGKAISSADKALSLYGDPNLNHSFSARFRKSLALRGLGRENRDKDYFDQALAIYEEHKKLRVNDAKLLPEEKSRLIANEEKNIVATRLEMQKL
jgi:tetratricopeptide (TPR) repeat protein